MVAWSPVKRTAMHYRHLKLGATMGDYGGWQRPAMYTSPEQETERVREAGGLCDTSPSVKHYIQGNDVSALLQKAFPEAGPFGINRACAGVFSGPGGPSIDNVLLCRFATDEAFIVSPPDAALPVAGALRESLSGCAHAVDMTSTFASVNIAGPMSAQLLAKLTDLDLSPGAFSDLGCAQGQVAEVYAIVARQDWGGLLSYQVYFGRDFGEYLWEALLHAGREYGVAPFGVEALKMLRLE